MPAEKHVAIYVRVSSRKQDHRSQLPDLKVWAESCEEPTRFYHDKASGRSMDRPGWKRLETAIRAGKVSRVVVWRLDRLGRTAGGLCTLFEELQERRVGLVSLRDAIDLETASGRLMAGVLASVAQYDNEVRGERVRAGQAVARANGKTWGGSEPGKRKVVTPQQQKTILRLKADGEPVTAIAKTVGLSRPTIYSVLEEAS